MIEAGVTWLRLLLGLGAIFFLGYALLTRLVPRPRDFTVWERAAFGFGVGALALTLWMLALTWWGALFSLGRIIGSPLALAAALLLTPRGRRAVQEDWQVFQVRPRIALSGWDWLFLGLLGLLFLYALPRAALYPMWAWDAVATWGCKARIFYTNRGLDLTCIDAHNYYPNLIPLLLSYLYFALGQANDSLVKVIFPLWGALLLGLLYSLAARLGLSRRWALGLAAFLALNGTVFIVHLYIAYADLPLACFTLGAAGLLYFWLADAAPRGSLTLTACLLAGLAWCKYEGPPLAATIILAAALTLTWLRPARWVRRLGQLSVPLAGLVLGYLPWRLFMVQQKLEIGSDHIQGFYPHQMAKAVYYLLAGLVEPFYFGFLWPALALALIFTGRKLWRSPILFLALLVGGNLAAIILAYAVAPTSAAEFPAYVRATLDRLLLHLTPTAALLLALGLKAWRDENLEGRTGGSLTENTKKSPALPSNSPPHPR
jgi:hypothetical protein